MKVAARAGLLTAHPAQICCALCAKPCQASFNLQPAPDAAKPVLQAATGLCRDTNLNCTDAQIAMASFLEADIALTKSVMPGRDCTGAHRHHQHEI